MKVIDNKDIRDILDKYFEALTTLEEEQRLRDYFAGEVASEFTMYKPLFDTLAEERKSIINVSEKLDPVERDDLIKRSSINGAFNNKLLYRLRWLTSVAAAAVVVLMLALLPGKRDSLQLVVDGINVKNNELAISMADSQLSRVNTMLGKYKQSNEQLANLNRVGAAISPLASLEKLLKQNDQADRLYNNNN